MCGCWWSTSLEVVTILGDREAAVGASGIGSPAVLVIGETVRLAALAAGLESQRAA